jgi:hypothetical protein
MGHNPGQVLMGAVISNHKEVTSRVGSLAAGSVCHLKSDGTVTTAKADGGLLGVSLGKDLSDTSRMAICRKGLGVPLLLTADFTPTVGAQVAVSDTTGLGIAYTGSGNSYVNAVYKSAKLVGISEAGTEVDVAIIDFPGGL